MASHERISSFSLSQEPTIPEFSENNPSQKRDTFLGRLSFIREVTEMYANGKISWDAKWFYIQKYGVGNHPESTESE